MKKLTNLESNDIRIDKENTTDILDALNKKSLPAVRYYFQQNPDIIHESYPLENGLTPLHHASKSGCLDIVKFLLSKGANVKTERGHFKWTPLHYASSNDHLPVVKVLLEKAADINQGDMNGFRPLHLAVDGGHFKVVKFLVEKGAKTTLRTKNGQTPLDMPKIKFYDKTFQNYLSSLKIADQ